MSKTVDELIGVYIEASNAVVWEAEKRGLCPMTLDMQRAGIAAVVSELMEHFVTGASTYAWDADDLHAEFMKILGAAGAEKVAGGSTREDEKAVEAAGDKGPVTVNSPATDPCPDCGGRKYLAKHALNGTYYVHCHCPKLKATDPAPAVCVWNTVAQGWEYDIVKRSCTGSEFRVYGSGEHTCPSCKAPIKFTEAKT